MGEVVEACRMLDLMTVHAVYMLHVMSLCYDMYNRIQWCYVAPGPPFRAYAHLPIYQLHPATITEMTYPIMTLDLSRMRNM